MLRELTLRLKSMNCLCSTSIYPCILVTVSKGKEAEEGPVLPTNCLSGFSVVYKISIVRLKHRFL